MPIHIVLFYTEVNCPHLGLQHGTVSYNTTLKRANGQLPWTSVTGYRVNTLASFLCDKDFRREGSSSAICQSSGNWTEEAPRCTASNESKNLYSIDSIDVCYSEKLFLTW